MKKTIAEQPWFIAIAWCLLVLGFLNLFFQPASLQAEADQPQTYCAMEVTYRDMERGTLTENSICMDRVLMETRP